MLGSQACPPRPAWDCFLFPACGPWQIRPGLSPPFPPCPACLRGNLPGSSSPSLISTTEAGSGLQSRGRASQVVSLLQAPRHAGGCWAWRPGGHQDAEARSSARARDHTPARSGLSRRLPHRLPSVPGLQPQRPQLTLDSPGYPARSPQPRLLGQFLVPAGGPRGLHCSRDGLLFVTAGAAPCVLVLDLEGRSICHLPCRTRGAGDFVPEDVAVTASGLVVVSDLVQGAVRALQHTPRAPQGRWATVGTFLSPRGLAVDALGHFLVTDYVLGAVHSFALGPTWEPLATAAVLGLRGPCWVGPGPDGGLAVSEEFGDVQLFGSARQSLGSLGVLAGHTFGCPAGVCSDSEGSLIVADEQRHQVTLFPRAGPPRCLLSRGLQRPSGVACAPQGQLVVADAGHNCIKVYQYLGSQPPSS